MGKLLTANEILAAPDLKQERVEVPEWGGDVILRGLSAYDREWFELSIIEGEPAEGADGKIARKFDTLNARAKLLSRAIVDEDGNAIFDESQLIALGRKSNDVIGRLFRKAQALSGIGENAVDKAEKNSDGDPNAGSSSV